MASAFMSRAAVRPLSMLLVVADMLFVFDVVLELLLDIVLDGLLVDADVLSVVVGEVFCPIAAKPEPKIDRTRKVRFIKITF